MIWCKNVFVYHWRVFFYGQLSLQLSKFLCDYWVCTELTIKIIGKWWTSFDVYFWLFSGIAEDRRKLRLWTIRDPAGVTRGVGWKLWLRCEGGGRYGEDKWVWTLQAIHCLGARPDLLPLPNSPLQLLLTDRVKTLNIVIIILIILKVLNIYYIS